MVGGHLAPGTYYAFYTFNYTYNYIVTEETSPSPISAPFTVTAGNIPLFSMPFLLSGSGPGPLPTGASSYNIYLSDSSADPGTATRYVSGVTTATFPLANAAPVGAARPPVTNAGAILPTVNPTGGGRRAAASRPGCTSSITRSSSRTAWSRSPAPPSSTFTVAAGNVPQVALPPLPAGAIGYNIYLSNNTVTPGSATRYATGVMTPTYNLTTAAITAGVNHPANFNALLATTVVPTGGNVNGAVGTLAPGTYFVQYSFTYPSGAESLPSPASNAFIVAAGNIPQVTLPPLPNGATGYNLYLSNATATPGSANLYAAGVTTPVFNLQNPAPTGPITPPINNFATTAPTVNPTGGGATGGSLLSGTYFAYYTFVFANGTETFASPNSAPFTVAAGNIPRVTLPPLPAGAKGINLYLSDDVANPGSATRYATGITTTTYDLAGNPLTGRIPPPSSNAWTPAPVISPTGGGVAGGNLAPGTYFAYYTFTNAAGVESFPSPNSAPFTVAAGNVPRVTLSALPAWATGIKLYLSNPLAQPGSTILYASGITTTALNLTSAAPAAGLSPVPLVNPTGGNATGLTGNLAPGTYFVFFTFNNAAGAEVYASASSVPFVVAHSGDIPQVTLPTLPPWASSYNIYLSNATATPGSATPYACGVTTPTYNLQAAPHSGGATTLLVGDNFNLPATAQVSARQSVTVRGDFGNVNPGTTAALDPDPGVGTVMNINSAIVAPNVLLTGQNDNETFNVQATAPGSKVTFDTGAAPT